MKFLFKARTHQGDTRYGTVDAPSRDMAREAMAKGGLTPLWISQEKNHFAKLLLSVQQLWEGSKPREIALFYRQLAILTNARVPMVQALAALSQQSTNLFLRRVIDDIVQSIEGGLSFSDALRRHPDVFKSLEINILRAGEAGGKLQGALSFVADSVESGQALKGRIVGALIYPAFVVGIASVIGFVVLTFVLPQITTVIKEVGAEIPWYTAVIIAVGDFMSNYWWAVLIIVAGVGGGGWYYLHTPNGRQEWDYLLLRLPVVGVLVRDVAIMRITQNLELLLAAGIPIAQALDIIADVVGNEEYRKIVWAALEEVRSGGVMSAAFRRSPHIPPMVGHMISVGEETGELEQALREVTKFYNNEVDQMTKNLTALLEPILISVLGIGVAIMVVGILVPIYNITNKIG